MPIQAYHGSDTPDITNLAAFQPNLPHGGDIGEGVYVSENFETAAAYGRYIYVLELQFDHGEIFDLSAENQYQVEGYEGTSVLTGEFIPPFYFFINGQKYLVGFSDEDIGTLEQAKGKLINAIKGLVPESVFNALATFIKNREVVPDADDIDDFLHYNLPEDVVAPNASEEQAEEVVRDIVSTLSVAVDEVNNWIEQNSALVLSLDEIGAEVESAGYKALYFERGGTVGDEILVFDPSDIKIVQVLDRKQPTEK